MSVVGSLRRVPSDETGTQEEGAPSNVALGARTLGWCTTVPANVPECTNPTGSFIVCGAWPA